MPDAAINTRCCIAGGGPAGMMLGFLLARAGVEVVVLEKHADFFRDFRGDTIHPSTLELMDELGLLDQFLKLPHQKIDGCSRADRRRARRRCRPSPPADALQIHRAYAAMGLSELYRRSGPSLPDVRSAMSTAATDLIVEGGRVAGLRAQTSDGNARIRADLVVGADGRHSTVRDPAGFESQEYGAPMDVLWFRLSRKDNDDPPRRSGISRPAR